jgi:hypothetical protein
MRIEQPEILCQYSDQAMGNIGLELTSKLFPDLANHIVGAECTELMRIWEISVVDHCDDQDIRRDFEERCELLAATIPGLTDPNFQELSWLARFFIGCDSTIYTGPLAAPLASLVTIGPPDFAAGLLSWILHPNDAEDPSLLWSPLVGPISKVILRIACTHREILTGDQIEFIGLQLLDALWDELIDDPDELSDLVDLLSVFVYVGWQPWERIDKCLEKLQDVDDPLIQHIRIRLCAVLYLMGNRNPSDILEKWWEMVEGGWFSTDYFKALTVLCFTRINACGQPYTCLQVAMK